jgi:hypothetical protein
MRHSSRLDIPQNNVFNEITSLHAYVLNPVDFIDRIDLNQALTHPAELESLIKSDKFQLKS